MQHANQVAITRKKKRGQVHHSPGGGLSAGQPHLRKRMCQPHRTASKGVCC